MIERDITLQQLRFSLCQWGDSSLPTILILHGWLDQAAGWSKVAEKLAKKGYCVLALDQRGHGCSEAISPCAHYHFPDYISDVAFLQKELQLAPFVIIGHSMGGTVASQYAALQPQHLQKLIVIEGLGPPHETPAIAFARYKKHLQQRLETHIANPLPSVDWAAKRLQKTHPYLADDFAYDLAQRITHQQNEHLFWRWDPRHRQRSAIGFDLQRHLYLLKKINTPTSLILGSNSWYMKLSDLQQRIDALQHLEGQYILKGGHSLHYEQPEQLASTILQILGTP